MAMAMAAAAAAASTASFPCTVSDFTLFPIIYGKNVHHILYAKAHSRGAGTGTSGAVLPAERTLFLVNVPPDTTAREITLFFKTAGIVERVVFGKPAVEEEEEEEEEEWNSDADADVDDEDEHEEDAEGAAETATAVATKETLAEGRRPSRRRKKEQKKDKPPVVAPLFTSATIRTLRPTGRKAYVVFLDSASVAAALAPSATGSCKPRAWPREQEAPIGLARYRALHDALRPPLDSVLAHAESAIALYDYQEARRRQKSQYRKGEAIVDEDGFTLVTRGGAYGQTLGGGVGVASKAFQNTGETSKSRKKKKNTGMGSLYAFEVHEKKRQQLVDLRNKWAEDLEKVKKLKESKRFKPY